MKIEIDDSILEVEPTDEDKFFEVLRKNAEKAKKLLEESTLSK